MTAPTRIPGSDDYAAGLPSAHDLAELAAAGVRTVIDLRAAHEPAACDEAAEAMALGMRYLAFPVAGAAELDPARVRAFGRELDDARRRGGVLVHCATSNRVGAMVALDAALNRGCGLQAALERGRAAGLKSLEPAVVERIEASGGRA